MSEPYVPDLPYECNVCGHDINYHSSKQEYKMQAVSDKRFMTLLESQEESQLIVERYESYTRQHYPKAIVALDMYRNGLMLPQPCLQFIKQVVTSKMLAELVEVADESFKAPPVKPRIPNAVGQGKYWIQFVCKEVNERTGEAKAVLWVDHNGKSTFRFDKFQDCERFIDRKHQDITTGLYATISQDVGEGKPLVTIVYRNDSLGRIQGDKRHPVTKMKMSSSSSM